MQATLSISLVAALVAAASGAVVLALNPLARPNRIGALLMAGIAWWAGCELLTRQAPDAGTALAWTRIGAPGLILLAAHAAWFSSALREGRAPRLARAVPALYALNGAFLLLMLASPPLPPLMLAGMQRDAFGWHPVVGTLYPVWLAQTTGVVGLCLAQWVRAARSASQRLAPSRRPRAAAALATAGVVLGAVGAVVVLLDLAAPRPGSLALALLGLAGMVALSRPGLSQLDASGIAREILRVLPDGLAVVDPAGRIRIGNPSMATLLADADAPVEGRTITGHLDLPVLEAGVEYRAQECELLQDSGFRIPVSVSTTPVRGAAGAEDHLLLIVRDVREVAALRKRLFTSERLAIVGRLAAGIAHEINNPLAFVRANLHHLHRELTALPDKPDPAGVRDAADELAEVVAESLEGIDRAMAIVRDVNTFSDAGGDASQPVDLGELIGQALEVVRLGLAPGVRLGLAAPLPEGLEVMGSPQRLRQLLLNLLVNAVQAVEDAGTVSIEARRDGRRVWIAVVDDGAGIATEDLGRIFDPFFTTRPVGSGTGLGLAICHEIARSHGGSIEVHSEAGRGTRVAVTLPARVLER